MTTPLGGFPVDYVAVVVGYKTSEKDKKGDEVVHQVDSKSCDILSVQHGIERKKVAVKDSDGSIARYEETGEEILTLKVKYIRGT
jgi:hypothetical protein